MDADTNVVVYAAIYLSRTLKVMWVEACVYRWNWGADDGKLKRYTSLSGLVTNSFKTSTVITPMPITVIDIDKKNY